MTLLKAEGRSSDVRCLFFSVNLPQSIHRKNNLALMVIPPAIWGLEINNSLELAHRFRPALYDPIKQNR